MPPKKSKAPENQPLSAYPPVDLSSRFLDTDQKEWKRLGLKRADFIDRLRRFALPELAPEETLSNLTIAQTLVGLQQVQLYAKSEYRWSKEQFIKNAGGPSGADYGKVLNLGKGRQKSSSDKDESRNTPETRPPLPSTGTTPEPPKRPKYKRPYVARLDSDGNEIEESPRRSSDDQKSGIPSASPFRISTNHENSLTSSWESTVRKAMLDYAYRELQRHPSAGAKYSSPHERITEAIEIGMIYHDEFPMKNITIDLSLTEKGRHKLWSFSKNNAPTRTLPFLGQGPIWSNNSCSFDACIVAGMFLNAGSTVADVPKGQTFSDYAGSLSNLPHRFQKLLDVNWSRMDQETKIESVVQLWRAYRRSLKRNGQVAPAVGSFQSALSVWTVCTEGFNQFRFDFRAEAGRCASCGNSHSSNKVYTTNEVNLEPLNGEPTMAELLQRFFGPVSRKCPTCKTPNGRQRQRIIHGDLPIRLAVVPPTRPTVKDDRIYDHTTTVCFDYRKKEGPRTATYRWLGGIYHLSDHFRVYWSDLKHGEPDTGSYCAYDGMLAEGAIIGGLSTAKPENYKDRLPKDWGQTILFYEQVITPPMIIGDVAAKTIHTIAINANATQSNTNNKNSITFLRGISFDTAGTTQPIPIAKPSSSFSHAFQNLKPSLISGFADGLTTSTGSQQILASNTVGRTSPHPTIPLQRLKALGGKLLYSATQGGLELEQQKTFHRESSPTINGDEREVEFFAWPTENPTVVTRFTRTRYACGPRSTVFRVAEKAGRNSSEGYSLSPISFAPCCFICSRDIFDTGFYYWQEQDGNVYARHENCWRCENCKTTLRLGREARGKFRTHRLAHKDCEKFTEKIKSNLGERCVVCAKQLSLSEDDEIAGSPGNYFCALCLILMGEYNDVMIVEEEGTEGQETLDNTEASQDASHSSDEEGSSGAEDGGDEEEGNPPDDSDSRSNSDGDDDFGGNQDDDDGDFGGSPPDGNDFEGPTRDGFSSDGYDGSPSLLDDIRNYQLDDDYYQDDDDFFSDSTSGSDIDQPDEIERQKQEARKLKEQKEEEGIKKRQKSSDDLRAFWDELTSSNPKPPAPLPVQSSPRSKSPSPDKISSTSSSHDLPGLLEQFALKSPERTKRKRSNTPATEPTSKRPRSITP